MNEWIDRARRFISHEMWRGEALWVRTLQLGFVIGEGFVANQLLLRAHSLTYITLLSLIPLLALAVSLMSAFGIQEDLVGMAVDQIGKIAPQAGVHIQELVEGVNFASLGTVGAATLVVTTILAVGNVEQSFNHIWGVQKQRGWVRRIPDYLAVVVVVPIVLGVAISLGTTLRSQAALGSLLNNPIFAAAYKSGLKQLPTVMMMLGFTFSYWFLPNTKVNGLSALLGGAVAGILFTLVQGLYVGLQVGAAKYSAVFGSFAALPLIIVWIYFSWSVVLLGAEVAFAHQHLARYRREVRGAVPGLAARESIGLGIALEVARRFAESGEPWTADMLSELLDVRVRTVREILAQLENVGVVAELADEDKAGQYQLGRPAERISVRDVLTALRGERAPLIPAVDQVFERMEKQLHEVVEHETLADLLRQ